MDKSYTSLLQFLNSEHVGQCLNDFIVSNWHIFKNENFESPSLKSYINFIKRNIGNDIDKYPIKFIYAIDNYDIGEYCFPFGVTFNENEKSSKNVDSLEILVDKQVSWYNFFKNNVPILIDEHIPELKQLVKKVTTASHTINTWNEVISILKSSFQISDEDKNELINSIQNQSLFNKNVPFLLSLMLGFGEDKIIDFKNIINNKLIITEEDSLKLYPDDDNYQKNIINAFNKARPGKLTFDLYDEFYRKKPFNYKPYNLYSDCSVIDRVIQINEYLEQQTKFIGTRYILKFFSSSKTTQRFAFNLETLKNKLPRIGKLPINIFKTVEISYLETLVSENLYDGINKEAKISSLKKIYNLFEASIYSDIYKQKNNLNHIITKRQEKSSINENTLKKDLNIQIDNLRSRNETLGIVKLLIDKTNKDRFLKAHEILNTQLRELNFNIVLNKLKEITSNKVYLNKLTSKALRDIINFRINYTCATVLNEILNVGLSTFKPYRSPNDLIIGLNHTYPTLFKSFGHDTKNLIALLKVIYNYNLYQVQETKHIHITKELKKFILFEDLDNLKTTYSIKNIYHRRLLTNLMICIIHPFEFKSNKTFNKRESGWEKIVLELIYDVKEDCVYLENAVLNSKADLEFLYEDYKYFHIMILRYFGQFEESIYEAEKFIENNKTNDPRFHHSLFLSKFCIFSSFPTEERAYSLLTLIEKGMLYYENFNEHFPDFNSYVRKFNFDNHKFYLDHLLHFSLFNAKIYIQLYSYENFKMITDIKNIGIQLREKKQYMLDRKMDTQAFSEYCFVEGLLEYYEAISENSFKKISQSRKAIERALFLEKNLFGEKNNTFIQDKLNPLLKRINEFEKLLTED